MIIYLLWALVMWGLAVANLCAAVMYDDLFRWLFAAAGLLCVLQGLQLWDTWKGQRGTSERV